MYIKPVIMLEYMSQEDPLEFESSSILLEIDRLVMQQNYIDLDNHIKKEYQLTKITDIFDISNCFKFSHLNETLMKAFDMITETDNKQVFNGLPLELMTKIQEYNILNLEPLNFTQILKKNLQNYNLEPISIQIFISLAITLCVHHIKIKNQIYELHKIIVCEEQNAENLSKRILFTYLIKFAMQIVDTFNKIFCKLIETKNYVLIYTLIQIISIDFRFETDTYPNYES